MKKGYVGVLILGIALGIAVALPVAALASNGSFFGGGESKTRAASSTTVPRPSPLATANVNGPQGAAQQTDQGQRDELHEQMHRMMDAVHGEGMSQRMHEAMGEDAEKMMDQCAAMMQHMQGMMGKHDMSDMMGR